jgi:protein subunit release factor B
MKKGKKELLFSITAKDCEFTATRGSGPGGQHRNKVSTAIRCRHKTSGAVGYSEGARSQHQNKKEAFRRMAESKTMQDWIRLEASRRSGELARIEDKIKEQTQERHLRVDVKNEKGFWKELEASEGAPTEA